MRAQKKNGIELLKSAIIEADDIEAQGSAGNKERLIALTEECLEREGGAERARIRRRYRAGAPLTGENGIRRQLGMIDLDYFGRAYLPHYFSRPSPAFHGELNEMWQKAVWKSGELTPERIKELSGQQGSRRAIAAPRGHAKSTNVTFKDSLHAAAYGYKHFIMILSDVADQAVGFLSAIKEEIEDNDALREDFGDLTGKVWRDNVIVTKSGVKILAKGAGQKVRGLKHKQWRPDLIVLDDIENDENVRTPEQRSKLMSWFFKAVSKCGDSYTDMIYIGTLLHYDSLLANILKNPGYTSIKYKAVLSFSLRTDLWDKWAELYVDLDNPARTEDAKAFYLAHEAEMLAGTAVLWPEKLSYYDLMEMRITEGEAAFNSEEQNEPIDPADCLFNEDWFDYFDPSQLDLASRDFRWYGFADPSLGKSKKSDYSAIITIAHHKPSGYMYAVDADVERRLPDRIIEDVLEKALWLKRDYGARYEVFGCETNQFQWFLKDQMAKESARRGIYLPLREIRQSSDKTLRIQGLQPYIKNKYIKFRKNQKRLLEQLKYFPMADHDDGPDALEGCVSLITGKAGRRIFGIRGM